MPTELLMPKSGMGITEGTLAEWHKAEGESFTEGELIVEIETAKAVEEVEAPFDGVLVKILVPEGEEAEVQTPIALLEQS